MWTCYLSKKTKIMSFHWKMMALAKKKHYIKKREKSYFLCFFFPHHKQTTKLFFLMLDSKKFIFVFIYRLFLENKYVCFMSLVKEKHVSNCHTNFHNKAHMHNKQTLCQTSIVYKKNHKNRLWRLPWILIAWINTNLK